MVTWSVETPKRESGKRIRVTCRLYCHGDIVSVIGDMQPADLDAGQDLQN